MNLLGLASWTRSSAVSERKGCTIGKLVLANGVSFEMDHLANNNALIVGGSGAGKTRSVVIPNLLQCNGSYVVSDPKSTESKDNCCRDLMS